MPQKNSFSMIKELLLDSKTIAIIDQKGKLFYIKR